MNTQTSTQVGHCKANDTDVYIGRGDQFANITTTPIGNRGWLGNPFVVETHARQAHYDSDAVTVVPTRSESINRFRDVFEQRLNTDEEFRNAVAALAGSTLGCWCQHVSDDTPACHGEVIAEHADTIHS